MNTLSKITKYISIIALSTILSSSTLFATEIPTTKTAVAFMKIENDKALLRVLNAQSSKIAVKIKSEKTGRTLFSSTYTNETILLKKLDLNGLEAGSYMLDIVSENQEIVQNFEITKDGNINIDDKQTKGYFAPHINIEEEKVNIAFQNIIESDITFHVIDADGKTVYSSLASKQLTFAKSFDLSNLATGTYKIKVVSGDFVYTEKLNIK